MKKKWTLMPMFLVMLFLLCKMDPVHAEVTSHVKYRQMDEELGKYIYSSLFSLDGGKKYAFCIERSKSTPGAGSRTSDWIEVFNEDLRKVLYYGYGGPEDKGYSVVETSCAAAAANGDNETSIGVKILAEIQMLPTPPAHFRIWKVSTNNGFSQELAFFTTLSTGELQLEKVSREDENVFLEGAIYGVYLDSNCTDQVATLATDETGTSETVTLDGGTYYLKEVQAPEGYELNDEILKVNVLVERTVVVTAVDDPIPPYIDLVIQKQNVIGEGLQGAEFAIYEDENCTQLLATGTTDLNGKLAFSNLIRDNTYYLKETKAPEGYRILEGVNPVVADGTEVPVVNERIFVLPNTGNSGEMMLHLLGVWCVIKSLKKEK